MPTRHHSLLETRGVTILQRKATELVVGGLILVASLGIASGAAAEPRTEVSIQCRDFIGLDELARVEVRVRTELRHHVETPGRLELACTDTSVTGGWRVGPDLFALKTLSVGPTDARPEMLLWLASLLLETKGEVAPQGTPSQVPSPEPGATDPFALGTFRSYSALELSRTPNEPEEVTVRKVQSKGRAAKERSPSRGNRPTFKAGLRYAYYGELVAGTVGPALGAELPLSDAFGIDINATLLLGQNDATALGLIDGGAFAGVFWSPLRGIQLVLGPALSWAHLSRGSGSQGSLTPGLEGGLKAHFTRGPLGMFTELGVRALSDARYAVFQDQDGDTLSTQVLIPHFHAFFSAGVTFAP